MISKEKFYPGFEIKTISDPTIGFSLGENTFNKGVEIRKLDAIRKSLMDPNCNGPENVYAIMMDVGNKEDYEDLVSRRLLYGAVCYSKGKLGQEPIRSQGHIHKESKYTGWSTPEIYEIWEGKAVIYMQEYGDDNPGRCFAIYGEAGDIIIVPPYWTHATINADADANMSFGAWCDRDYGFVYDKVRAHGGIAFFPIYDNSGKLSWVKNPAYRDCSLIEKKPGDYTALGIKKGVPIYTQYQENRSMFDFVSNPKLFEEVWKNFNP